MPVTALVDGAAEDEEQVGAVRDIDTRLPCATLVIAMHAGINKPEARGDETCVSAKGRS